jgi:hypothetical protein
MQFISLAYQDEACVWCGSCLLCGSEDDPCLCRSVPQHTNEKMLADLPVKVGNA